MVLCYAVGTMTTDILDPYAKNRLYATFVALSADTNSVPLATLVRLPAGIAAARSMRLTGVGWWLSELIPSFRK